MFGSRHRRQPEPLGFRSCPADEILNRTATLLGMESVTRSGQMDLACLLRARSLCSRRLASSRYAVRLLYDKVRWWLPGDHLWPATAYPMNPKLKPYGFAPLALLLSAILMGWAGGFARTS